MQQIMRRRSQEEETARAGNHIPLTLRPALWVTPEVGTQGKLQATQLRPKLRLQSPLETGEGDRVSSYHPTN